MESIFGWFGNLIEWFGDLIPRYQIVSWDMRFMASTRGNDPVIREKSFFYWPFWTDLESCVIKRRIVLGLTGIDMTTKDGKAIRVDGCLAFEVTDAFVHLKENFNASDSVDELACCAIRETARSYTWDQLVSRLDMLDRDLTQAAQDDLECLGIEVEYLHAVPVLTRVISLAQ